MTRTWRPCALLPTASVSTEVIVKGKSLRRVDCRDNSQVVAGQYEGGHNVWECSTDLIGALTVNIVKGKNIFEIGCGHGLPGIWCLKYGEANHVVFQDLNEDVLEQRVLPNLSLNVPNAIPDCVTFLAGEWHDIATSIGPLGNCMVLCAEALYRPCDFEDLVSMLLRLMTLPGDIAIFASKRYYFGLGGGSREFIRFIGGYKEFGPVEYVNEVRDGRSNIRDVFILRRQTHV